MKRWETRPGFYLCLVDDVYSFFLIPFFFSFLLLPLSLSLSLSLSLFLSHWRMKTQQQIALLCNAASSNELGVCFRVSVTVHSNRQSSLHPLLSGASFVNAQSPPRQNYRTRRTSTSFPDWWRNDLFFAAINLMIACCNHYDFFSRRT